ncbi:MAG: DUF5818 domain-containing protein [Syntrophobacterales bacterium]|nr:DUF5818 domain-containing protein [Syntrophobacterales bacterium]
MKRWMVMVSVVMALVIGFVFSVPMVQAAEEAKKEGVSTPPSEKQEPTPTAEKKEATPGEVKLISMKGKVEIGGEAILFKMEDGKEFKLEGTGLKDFAGKQVQVAGELDEATKTIKVKEIKPSE